MSTSTIPRMVRRLRRFWTARNGAAAAEFALLAPIMLLFVFSLYQFGRAFWIQNMLQFAAEETARWGMVSKPACTSSGLQTQFNNSLATLSSSGITFSPSTSSYTSTAGVPMYYCQIKATYAYSVLPMFAFTGASFTIAGQAGYACNPNDKTLPTTSC